MNLIVAGCGRLGCSLARTLEREGHRVAVVDPLPEALDRLGQGFHGTRVRGSPMGRKALLEAGVERCDGLAATTGSDTVNLAVASAARRLFRVPRVVARVHDLRRTGSYQRLGVQTFSPLPSSVRRVAEMLGPTAGERVGSLGTGLVDLVEVAVPHSLVGHPFGRLEVAGEVRPVALLRAGRATLPPRQAILEEGDRVVVAATGVVTGRLGEILGLE